MRDAELKQRFMHFLSLLPARPERRSLIDKLLGKRTVDHAGSSEYDWPVLMTDDGGGGGDGVTLVEHGTRAPTSDDRRAKRKEAREKRREERREKKKEKKEKKREKKKREKRKKTKEGKCSRCEELIASTERKEKKKRTASAADATLEAVPVPALSEEEATLRREREKRRERRRREKEDKRKRKSAERERKGRKEEEKRERAERKKRKEEEKDRAKEERRRRRAGRAASGAALDGNKKPRVKKTASIKREVSGLTAKDLNFDRRWNEEYQSLLDKVHTLSLSLSKRWIMWLTGPRGVRVRRESRG
jgi:hypothetical protein